MASQPRTVALGKYLVAATNSFDEAKDAPRKRGSGPSAKRKRLHVLYLLHDVLYHTIKRHPGNGDFAKAIEGHLAPLFLSVSAFPGAPKHTAKIMDVLDFWEEIELVSATTVADLRSLVRSAAEEGKLISRDAPQGAAPTSSKLSKEAPFTLPPTHGDPSLSWFDLPAANWLPHLTPNSTKPIKPDMIKPLQFAQGPADKAVVEAVRTLLGKVDQLFSKEAKWDEHTDLNEMGERVLLDEVSGEVVGGETYYGWSRAFCKKMKDRHSKPQDQRGRSRLRSSSRSGSASPPLHKRRRLSPSYSPSRSRTPSPRRRAERARGYSRSRSPDRYRRSRSPSRRRSRSRTPSPSRHRGEPRYRRSPSPRNDGATGKAPPFYPPAPPMPPHQQIPAHQHAPMPPHGIPPPPPYGYTGPWPPPPPPPFPPGGIPQGWGAPPPGAPPGAPPGGHNQQFNSGRGAYQGDSGRGRGRGGWGW